MKGNNMTNYRMLEVGEVIQEGDEYESPTLGRWRATVCAVKTVNKHNVGCYRRPIESKEGKSMFVEEVKTKKIKEAIDGRLPNGAEVSLKGPDAYGDVELVVGARWSDRGARFFDKKSLTELINNLVEVRDLMEGED